MSLSRRQLESQGLPIGGADGAGLTRRGLGGRVICGGGGDSSSSSTSNWNASDRRIVAAPGSVSVSGDSASGTFQDMRSDSSQTGNGINTRTTGAVTVQTLDAGALRAANDIAARAMDLTATGTRLASQNISEVLNTVDDLSGRYTTATRNALDSGLAAQKDALSFADANDRRFVGALESLTNKTITVAERAQSDVVGAYQKAADTTSGVRQIIMTGAVIAGIVAIAALRGKM